MPIGTLTKKIQCQLTAWVIRPPATSPTAAPAEATKLKIPKAFACSAGSGNMVTIIARITAELAAPPTPWMKRAAIRNGCEVERPQAREAAVKTATPIMKTRLPPTRSASRPASSSSPAKATR